MVGLGYALQYLTLPDEGDSTYLLVEVGQIVKNGNNDVCQYILETILKPAFQLLELVHPLEFHLNQDTQLGNQQLNLLLTDL